jgi:hypothetical protein
MIRLARPYFPPNAARRIAPAIISRPAIVAKNPIEIKNPPNAVLGPHGPMPLANVSKNAAAPRPKHSTPYFARFFTPIILSTSWKATSAKFWLKAAERLES